MDPVLVPLRVQHVSQPDYFLGIRGQLYFKLFGFGKLECALDILQLSLLLCDLALEIPHMLSVVSQHFLLLELGSLPFG